MPTSASLSERLLSVAYYFGLSPLARLWRSRASNPFLQHHHAQAMAAFFVMLLVFLTIFLLEVGATFVCIYFPDIYGRFNQGVILELALLLGLAILWLLLIGLSLAGSIWPVILLKRLVRQTWVIRVSSVSNALVLVLIPFIAWLAYHATSLTRANREGAAVYVLYDEGIPVPRWGYALGLYCVTLQAQRNWGADSMVLDRLTKQSLRTALASGKVMILATHGGNGYACTYYAPEKLVVAPPDMGATNEKNNARFLRMGVLSADNKWGKLENVEVKGELQLAYIFGCDAGKMAARWEEHLSPARVITYNRPSTLFDHALWFAFTGPGQLEGLR